MLSFKFWTAPSTLSEGPLMVGGTLERVSGGLWPNLQKQMGGVKCYISVCKQNILSSLAS